MAFRRIARQTPARPKPGTVRDGTVEDDIEQKHRCTTWQAGRRNRYGREAMDTWREVCA